MNLIVQIYLVFFQSLKEQVFLGIVQVKTAIWFGRYYCEKSWNKNLMKSFFQIYWHPPNITTENFGITILPDRWSFDQVEHRRQIKIHYKSSRLEVFFKKCSFKNFSKHKKQLLRSALKLKIDLIRTVNTCKRLPLITGFAVSKIQVVAWFELFKKRRPYDVLVRNKCYSFLGKLIASRA